MEIHTKSETLLHKTECPLFPANVIHYKQHTKRWWSCDQLTASYLL